VLVIDPLEEIFTDDDADRRAVLFHLLDGLWSLRWCTVILCMRADFYGALMAERCWHELKDSKYEVLPLERLACARRSSNRHGTPVSTSTRP
jgi:hypothetical protein